MEWLKLTAPDFDEACKRSRFLCILPFGCIEKHGEHLPLGTDSYVAEALSKAAAEVEPAVVFPVVHFFENAAAMPFPGAIAVRWDVSFTLLENLCEEIFRNGFKKILFVNAHGGNKAFIKNFLRNSLKSPKPYILYSVFCSELITKEFEREVLDNLQGGHANEGETSIMMHLMREFVKMENLPEEPGVSQDRLKHIEPVTSPLAWNANFPTHYSGDASLSTAEKGKQLFEHAVTNLGDIISRIKEDRVSSQLFNEFNSDAFKI